MIDDSSSAHAAPAGRLSRLSHALIAKSVIEGLFVVALAVYFSYTHFNPYFRGALDVADASVVAGWAVNEAAPGERVEVHLYIDGHFAGRRTADAPRPDVLAAGHSFDADHGFVFETPPLPPDDDYEARVYVMHAAREGTRRVLQEIGNPVRFGVAADERSLLTPDVWWESERRR